MSSIMTVSPLCSPDHEDLRLLDIMCPCVCVWTAILVGAKYLDYYEYFLVFPKL